MLLVVYIGQSKIQKKSTLVPMRLGRTHAVYISEIHCGTLQWFEVMALIIASNWGKIKGYLIGQTQHECMFILVAKSDNYKNGYNHNCITFTPQHRTGKLADCDSVVIRAWHMKKPEPNTQLKRSGTAPSLVVLSSAIHPHLIG